MRRSQSVPELVERVRDGQPGAVARLVTWVENGAPQLPEAMSALIHDRPWREDPHVVGVTGPPGVGKSTLTSALVGALRDGGSRVAVLAVDPSSPFSGGALLGDRVRMQEHATDDGVFIRSMAARGHLGGLAAATGQAVRVLAAAGFGVVLIETVGVGQSEIEIAGAADSVLLVLAPGAGDGVQAAKAGVLEIADIYVVNKADRDGAHSTARELRTMLRMGSTAQRGDWAPPVLSAVAQNREGITELVDALAAHHAWARTSGTLADRRRRRAAAEISALAVGAVHGQMIEPAGGDLLGALATRVAAGQLDAYQAARHLLAATADGDRAATAGSGRGQEVNDGATPTAQS